MRIVDLLKKKSIMPGAKLSTKADAIDLMIRLHDEAGNLADKEEYRKRAEEQRRLIERMNEKLKYPVSVLEGEYDAHTFFEMAKGMEHLPEGGERCFHCYAMRLERTAAEAKKRGMDYFTTTLSISPMKKRPEAQ